MTDSVNQTSGYQSNKSRLNLGRMVIILGTGVLVYLLVIVLFNFFNLVTIPNNLPLVGSLPHKTNSDTNNPATPINPTLSAVSDLPGYSLTMEDETSLKKYVDDFDLWSKTYNELAQPTRINSIRFHLSDRKGPDANIAKASDGSEYTSEYVFANSTFDLFIYLSPGVVSSANSSDVFTQAVMTNLRDLALKNGDVVMGKVQSTFNKYTDEDSALFKIEKSPK